MTNSNWDATACAGECNVCKKLLTTDKWNKPGVEPGRLFPNWPIGAALQTELFYNL